ncbi:MAG: DNA repair protein RecO [Bacilli bacterium]|nr:DNA repair protein RecO [Bacilli bacterium]
MERVVKGYVLRVVPYKESNSIITLLTEAGLESFMARGVMKPTSKNAASCQLYTYGEYQLNYKTEGSHHTLTSGVALKTLTQLYENLRYSVVLGLISECILKNDDFEEPYKVFDTVFKHLASSKCNFATIIAIVLKLNSIYSGCNLEADECVRCGSNKSIYSVSYNEGGLMCASCSRELHIHEKSPTYIKNFRYVVKAEIEHIDKFEIDPIVSKSIILDLFDFLEKNAGVYFKSKSMLLYLL